MIKENSISILISRQITIGFPIYYISGIFTNNNNKELPLLCRGRSIFVIIDKNVARTYGNLIHRYFFSLTDTKTNFLELESTEKNKNLSTVFELCSKAKKIGLKRDSILIGIGGGILLDMVGMAAAIFRRKIDYVRIPTTLIGIVDAGVGIKVGVNFENSKNFLGNFYPPLAVFNDQSFLTTLSSIDIKCGLYEILKLAIIRNEDLFHAVENNYAKFLNKTFDRSTEEINKLAIRLMLNELEPNLFETDLRRFVDFGHAFSAYIETSSNYKIPHGMAVGLDMLISICIANQRKLLNAVDFGRIIELFRLIGLSDLPDECTTQALHESLDSIKNHRGGNLNLPIPVKIGKAIFINECRIEEVEKAVMFTRQFVKIMK